LVVNLAVQIFIGIPLEMVHGWWRVLLIYVTGVVAGSLGTSMTDPMSKLAEPAEESTLSSPPTLPPSSW
jgi:rhomboid-related protein 1/2/3